MTLTNGELANMREVIASLMPDTCGIVSYTYASDGAGGMVETASGTATAICRLDKQKGTEKLTSGAITPFTGWVLSLPYDTTITEQNRVTHGGYTYNVLSVNTDASWLAVKRAMLERVP
jgi:hypothetical protein